MFVKKEVEEKLKDFRINMKSLFGNNMFCNNDKAKIFDTYYKNLLSFLGWKDLIFN